MTAAGGLTGAEWGAGEVGEEGGRVPLQVATLALRSLCSLPPPPPRYTKAIQFQIGARARLGPQEAALARLCHTIEATEAEAMDRIEDRGHRSPLSSVLCFFTLSLTALHCVLH